MNELSNASMFRYFGLSSSGMTSKSSSASYGSSSFQSADRYGGISTKRDNDSFKDSYSDNDQLDKEKVVEAASAKSHKKGSTRYGRLGFLLHPYVSQIISFSACVL